MLSVLLFSVFFGIVFVALKKGNIPSELDRLAGAKGLIKASHEFCTKNIPGSLELKEKTAQSCILLLKENGILKRKLLDIFSVCVIAAVLVFVPRFADQKYFKMPEVRPSGDTAVFWGEDMLFSAFPAQKEMQLFVMTGQKELKSYFSGDTFYALLESPERKTDFVIIMNSDTLASGSVDVFSPPFECVRVMLKLPPYIAEAEYPIEYRERYDVPKGSLISFEIYSRADIISWRTSDACVIGDKTDNSAVLIFRAEKESDFFIEGVSVLKDTLRMDIFVGVVEDSPPECKIIDPVEKTFSAQCNSDMNIKIAAKDDHGLTYAGLYISRKSVRNLLQEISLEGKGPVAIDFCVSPDISFMMPGDTAFIYALVMDNNPNRGTSFSDTIFLIMPSLYEIFASSDSAETRNIDRTKSFRERGTQLFRDMEILEQRLRLADSLSDSDEESFRDLIEEHKKFLDDMSGSLEEMRNYFNASMETYYFDSLFLQKTFEIAKLYDEVLDEDTKNAFEKLYEFAQNADEERIREVLERLKNKNEDLLESLERTLNLLKRLELEKKLEELARRSFETADASTGIDETDNQRASRQLSALNEEIESILKEISELNRDLMTENVFSEIQKAENEGEAALKEIDKMDGSAHSSSELTARLSSMSGHLLSSSRMMSGFRRSEASALTEEMKRCMLGISELEESIHLNQRPSLFSSASFASCIRSKNIIDSLSGLTSLIDRDLGRILSEMERELKKPEYVGKHLRVMKLANDAYNSLERMNRIMENSISSGGSSGMMEALSDLAGEQAQMNNSLMQAFGNQGMNGQKLAEMAAYQRAISQKLTRMSGSSGSSARILSELEEIARQMELSADAIESGEISRELIQRQRGILQRLLQSQRALREQQTRPFRSAQRPENDYIYPFVTGIDNFIQREEFSKNIQFSPVYGSEIEQFWIHLLTRYYDAGF
ncbi:hypothetical protein JW890_08800 [candidate division WOR-3 bacterium]|nr:hypothetical protein [candidate division WOR-3 bacterium]